MIAPLVVLSPTWYFASNLPFVDLLTLLMLLSPLLCDWFSNLSYFSCLSAAFASLFLLLPFSPNNISLLVLLLLFFVTCSGTANPCFANTALASSNSFSLRTPGLSCVFFVLHCLNDYFSSLSLFSGWSSAKALTSTSYWAFFCGSDCYSLICIPEEFICLK